VPTPTSRGKDEVDGPQQHQDLEAKHVRNPSRTSPYASYHEESDTIMEQCCPKRDSRVTRAVKDIPERRAKNKQFKQDLQHL
jgi:hypothetical protein